MSTEEFNNQLATLCFEQAVVPLKEEVPSTIKPKAASRVIRSWIFTKGYARRTRGEDSSRHVECLVPGCGKKYTSHDGSTSNIGRHLLRAHGIAKDGVSPTRPKSNFIEQRIPRQSPLMLQQVSRLSPELLNQKLVDFAIEMSLPFEILESSSFKELLKAFQTSPPVESLSLHTALSLESSISTRFEHCKIKIGQLLRSQESLCLSVKLCSTAGEDEFLEVYAHFIDEHWIRREILIGYEYPEGSCSGANLADTLVRLLDAYGIANHVFTITSDDSPMILSMLRELEILASQREDLNFTIENQHIPCIAAIMSSAVQKALTDGLHSKFPGDNFENGLLSIHDLEVLTKTRFGIYSIASTNNRVKYYQELCNETYKKDYPLKLDSKTECNSTIYFIERVIRTKEAYNETCDTFEELAPYKLVENDLGYLQKLYLLLSNFKELCDFLSFSRFPSLNQMIPAYHMLMSRIENFSKSDIPYTMKNAASWAHATLNSFYNTSTNSTVYSVTTAMDPQRKFEYWDELGWSKESSEKARLDVVGVWNAAFKCGPLDVSPIPSDDGAALLAKFTFKKNKDTDELERYLNEATLSVTPSGRTELEYWSRSSMPFQNLSRMARKYLAIPATSMPCTRLFATDFEGPYVSSPKTKPSTKRMCTLLKAWSWIS